MTLLSVYSGKFERDNVAITLSLFPSLYFTHRTVYLSPLSIKELQISNVFVLKQNAVFMERNDFFKNDNYSKKIRDN